MIGLEKEIILMILCLAVSLTFTSCQWTTPLVDATFTERTLPAPENISSEMEDAPDFVYGSNGLDTFPLLIAEERVAIAARDLKQLGALWAADGQIIDQRGTKDTEDDYIWHGRNAILDRYAIAVFRYSPPLIEPPSDLSFACGHTNNGSQSLIAESYSVEEDKVESFSCLDGEIGEETLLSANRGSDYWRFVFRHGRWWILSLTYN